MKVIPLTQGQVALVDDADYESLSKFKWRAYRDHNTFYAMRNTPRPNRRYVRMHQEITGLKKVDHADGNGLNNQRHNLRAASHNENMWNRRLQQNNTSGFKGVYFSKRDQKWKAQIRFQRQRIHLGYFLTAEEAAKAYDAAALKHFGKFAAPNFKCNL